MFYSFHFLILIFAYTSPSFANASESSDNNIEHLMPILDMYYEEAGIKTYNTDKSVSKDGKQTKITLKTKVKTEKLDSKLEAIDNQVDTFVFDGKNIVTINGEDVSYLNDSTDEITLSKEDLKKIKPLAEKLKKNDLSIESYIDKVGQLDLDLYRDNQSTSDLIQPFASNSGGLSWITYYSKSTRGGYIMKAGKMKGFLSGGLDAFLLDSTAVTSGSVVSKHSYLTSNDGGKVSSFMIRADSVKSARNSLLIDAAALAGALGVGLLTVATIVGAITAAGAVGALAIRMYNTSSSAHGDIQRAYEILGTISHQAY